MAQPLSPDLFNFFLPSVQFHFPSTFSPVCSPCMFPGFSFTSKDCFLVASLHTDFT